MGTTYELSCELCHGGTEHCGNDERRHPGALLGLTQSRVLQKLLAVAREFDAEDHDFAVAIGSYGVYGVQYLSCMGLREGCEHRFGIVDGYGAMLGPEYYPAGSIQSATGWCESGAEMSRRSKWHHLVTDDRCEPHEPTRSRYRTG